MNLNAKTADVRARIDPGLKKQASDVLSACGMSISEAFRLFLLQVVASKGLPFEVRQPNADTLAALEEARAMQAKRFASPQELFDALQEEARTAGATSVAGGKRATNS